MFETASDTFEQFVATLFAPDKAEGPLLKFECIEDLDSSGLKELGVAPHIFTILKSSLGGEDSAPSSLGMLPIVPKDPNLESASTAYSIKHIFPGVCTKVTIMTRATRKNAAYFRTGNKTVLSDHAFYATTQTTTTPWHSSMALGAALCIIPPAHPQVCPPPEDRCYLRRVSHRGHHLGQQGDRRRPPREGEEKGDHPHRQ
jgi:hypothetical protein